LLHARPGSGNNGVFRLDYGTGSTSDGYLELQVTTDLHYLRAVKSGGGVPLGFEVNSVERARIDTSGRLLVGTSSTGSTLTKTVEVHSAGTSTNQPALQVYSYPGTGNAVNTGYFEFYRSRGSTVGTNTIVASGDRLGMVRFNGANGTGYDSAAEIYAEVDGTPGASGDMPGRLVFATTADGAGIPTERARLTSTGALLVGTSTTPTGAAAGAVVANTQVVIGGRTNYQYAGSTSTVTASTGTVVFKFKSNSIGNIRGCFVKLSFFARANSSTPANSPAAEYAFQLHHTSANVSTLNGATSIFEYTFVRATHFAFANLGGGECTVTLTNPTALELRPGYKVEIINAETAGVWTLDTVTVT
jgi:hypothetical protein